VICLNIYLFIIFINSAFPLPVQLVVLAQQ
jgi:hypothetical protein